MKIHAWGGFGSQLFAIALAEDVRKRFPHKHLVIVLHSGGITKRMPEITSLFKEYDFEFNDDFHEKAGSAVEQRPYINWIKFLKYLAVKSGFIAEVNTQVEFSRIKPWCIATRGHYSYRTINRDFIQSLYEKIFQDSRVENNEIPQIAIHYRLGDLLNTSQKTFIDPGRIALACRGYSSNQSGFPTYIFSDSPDAARLKLQQYDANWNLEAFNLPIKETIMACVHATYFVGTSSKISFWIAAFRSQLFSKNSLLPFENQREYIGLLKDFQVDSYCYS